MVRHSNWLFPFLVAHSHGCCFLAAPGEEMVPSKEAMVVRGAVRVAGYTKRLTVKPPVAPANRPVPPVMVAISTAARTPGVGVELTLRVKRGNSVWPLAATQ